jgi:hypothetical protein
MDDDNELSGVRESLIAEGADLAGVHMNRPAEEVMARGRTLRLRRRLLRGLSGVTAASAAMALALTLPFGGAGFRQVHVNEAAWSVNTNQDGTVTLQVRKAADPVRLETVLSQAGVPAKVSWGESCGTVGQVAPLKGFVYGSAPSPKTAHNRGVVSIGWTVTFKPGQRPSNTIYYLGSRTSKAGHANVLRFVLTVVPNTLHLACAKGPHAISSPHATASGSPQPTATPRPHPTCSPRPHATPSPYGTPSPRATRTVRPHPAPTTSPSRTATPRPHPSCFPRPFASPSPHGTPSPSGTSSPYESPSPWGAPASSPAAG